jgi:hypothetical protein
MEKLHSLEVDITTYHFWVHKTIGISSSRVMFMEHHSLSHGVGTFLVLYSWTIPFQWCLD